jgi:hypothetical protein
VIGRLPDSLGQGIGPKITRIVVLDLTEETMGNAIGVGMADFTTTRLVQKIDRDATYMNALTSLRPDAAKIPTYFDTDRKAIDASLDTLINPLEARIIRIKNTLLLTELEVSEAYIPILKKRRDLSQLSEAKEMEFDCDGNLLPFGT